MTAETPQIERTAHPSGKRRFDRLHVVLMVLLALFVGAVVSFWVLTVYVFPDEFKPVVLSAEENQVLDAKLSRLESAQGMASDTAPALQPEAYSEAGANRSIALTEKELKSAQCQTPAAPGRGLSRAGGQDIEGEGWGGAGV